MESKVSFILALFPALIMVIPLAFNFSTRRHLILGHLSRNKSETFRGMTMCSIMRVLFANKTISCDLTSPAVLPEV